MSVPDASRDTIAVSYVDDEDDVITIGTDAELAEAFRFVRDCGRRCLRVTLTQKKTQKETPKVATSSPPTATAAGAGAGAGAAAPPTAPPTAPPAASSSSSAPSPVTELLAAVAPLLGNPRFHAALAKVATGQVMQEVMAQLLSGADPASIFASGAALNLVMQLGSMCPEVYTVLPKVLPLLGSVVSSVAAEGPAGRLALVAQITAAARAAGVPAGALASMGLAQTAPDASTSAPVTEEESAAREAAARAAAPDRPIHRRVECDGCGIAPIVGTRFKCAVCKDFDLCESCEATTSHNATHAFLQIKTPAQAPAAILTVLREEELTADTDADWRAPRSGRRNHRRGGKQKQKQKKQKQPQQKQKKTQKQQKQRQPAAAVSTASGAGAGAGAGSTPAAAAPAAPQTLNLTAAEAAEQKELMEAIQASLAMTVTATPDKEPAAATKEADEAVEEVVAKGIAVTEVAAPATAVDAATPPPPPPAYQAPAPPATTTTATATTTAVLDARFIKNVGPAQAVVTPGAATRHVWQMQNVSGAAWPAGCRLVHVGNDRMGGPKEGIEVPAVAAGETVNITLELTAPNTPGRHVSYWRLVDPEGTRFGHRVWADVMVHAVEEEEVATTTSASTAAAAEETTDAAAAVADDETPFAAQRDQLMAMGFDREVVLNALAATSGDAAAAFELMINNQ